MISEVGQQACVVWIGAVAGFAKHLGILGENEHTTRPISRCVCAPVCKLQWLITRKQGMSMLLRGEECHRIFMGPRPCNGSIGPACRHWAESPCMERHLSSYTCQLLTERTSNNTNPQSLSPCLLEAAPPSSPPCGTQATSRFVTQFYDTKVFS